MCTQREAELCTVGLGVFVRQSGASLCGINIMAIGRNAVVWNVMIAVLLYFAEFGLARFDESKCGVLCILHNLGIFFIDFPFKGTNCLKKKTCGAPMFNSILNLL